MIRQTVTIINQRGLHARATAKLVALAKSFDCNISIVRDEQKVDGKNIMAVMMLAASLGTELIIEAEGPDEHAAVTALSLLVAQRFEENE